MDEDPTGMNAFAPTWCEDAFIRENWASLGPVMQQRWIAANSGGRENASGGEAEKKRKRNTKGKGTQKSNKRSKKTGGMDKQAATSGGTDMEAMMNSSSGRMNNTTSKSPNSMGRRTLDEQDADEADIER
ncbi:hypothetical protein K439DRAFT_1621348 [Ramaria rubella]|nr:hypothetical protein K439DRAFT_1621348 [Ramaria rubella]